MKKYCRAGLRLLGAVLFVFATAAFAQTYPNKPVRIFVGFAPGGGSDIIARVIAQKLTEAFGQQFVVENRVGASGIIAADLVSKAPPDGYTLLVSSQTSTAAAAGLYPKLPYDVLKDFNTITVLGVAPALIVVHPSLPAKTFPEFVSFVKANQKTLNYGSAGYGSTAHLAGELFNQLLGTKIQHVPYKGESAAIAEVIAGQVPITWTTLPSALPHVRAGKVKALAITSLQRSPLAKEFPTVHESGIPGYEVMAWNAIYAPAALPREIAMRINAEAAKALRMPDVRERLAVLGIEPVGNTPEQAAAYLRSETIRWSKVIKIAGLKAEF